MLLVMVLEAPAVRHERRAKGRAAAVSSLACFMSIHSRRGATGKGWARSGGSPAQGLAGERALQGRTHCPVDLYLVQCLASQADAIGGRLAQQHDGLREAARASFMVKQHHCQVVLPKRIAALRGGAEVAPRLDMIAHEPCWTPLHQIQILGCKWQWIGWRNLGACGARIGKQQAAEQLAHDSLARWLRARSSLHQRTRVVKTKRNRNDEMAMRTAPASVSHEPGFDAGSRLPLGRCVLDLQARELRTADDRPVELRRKALDVLLVLAENAGRVVDKETLMDRSGPGSSSAMTR